MIWFAEIFNKTIFTKRFASKSKKDFWGSEIFLCDVIAFGPILAKRILLAIQQQF